MSTSALWSTSALGPRDKPLSFTQQPITHLTIATSEPLPSVQHPSLLQTTFLQSLRLPPCNSFHTLRYPVPPTMAKLLRGRLSLKV